jgi:hypothetical protein
LRVHGLDRGLELEAAGPLPLRRGGEVPLGFIDE